MRLTDEEHAMLAGELGAPRRWAIAHQIAVGEFFDALDFVPVSLAHVMADAECLGEVGVAWLERPAAAPDQDRRVREQISLHVGCASCCRRAQALSLIHI